MMAKTKVTSCTALILSLSPLLLQAETTILNVPDHERLAEHIATIWGSAAIEEMAPCEGEEPNRTRLRKVDDEELNKPVFEVSSIAADAGCNANNNRFRSEIKANNLDATKGSVTEWRFLFKLPSSFEPTNSFTHLMQAKAEPDANARFRLSSYQRNGGQTLEFNYQGSENDGGGFQYLCILGVEADATKAKNCQVAEAYKNKDASVLYGRWLDVKVKTTWLDKGVLDFQLADYETKDVIMTYQGELVLWSDQWEKMRPKFGLYREQKDFDGNNISEVSVRFSDITITRGDDIAYIRDDLSVHLPYVNVNGVNVWAQLAYNEDGGWDLNSFGVNSMPVTVNTDESSDVELAPGDLSLSIPAIIDSKAKKYSATLMFAGDPASKWHWQLRDFQIVNEEQ